MQTSEEVDPDAQRRSAPATPQARHRSAPHPCPRRIAAEGELWQKLTDQYVVDLDAVAALLPATEPETHWLPARD